MPRIVVELTNRCNLACKHCFSGRHGGNDDLPLELLERMFSDAARLGFDDVSFTGGDPTVHKQFDEVLRITFDAGFGFSMVTNGQNFPQIYPRLLPYRERLRMVTFSLDGASEVTHDRLRGRGAFRRVMQAISVSVVEEIPFSINMVITSHNRHELSEMVAIASRLGANGVRFGHLMPAPLTTAMGLDLSPDERREVEQEFRELARTAPILVAMAPGYETDDPFPCAPLNLEEVNVDCQGNLTKCCHLSGHGDGAGRGDIIGNLAEIGFAEAFVELRERTEKFRTEKLTHMAQVSVPDTDRFPCWHCSLFYEKVDWLRNIEGHSWSGLVRRIDESSGETVRENSEAPQPVGRTSGD